ncbi:pyrophosphatase PpaX [Bacillus piscicola]|uniref:pyrophosphatase PpaX n=1 Tax=Bacillus piscicola TaxID=1632684 RepID=UPI001F099316|nr:pyrophosphatase PpaX [Bacillus piscicola]
MTINTVLFDLDGTLINTNDLIIASFEYVLDKYAPGRYSREDIIHFIGPPLTDSFQEVDPERAEEMIALYQKHNLAHHHDLLKEYEGVTDTVKELYDHGYKLGIVTTKRKQSALLGIKEAGLAPYFPVVVTFDDVDHVKPNPEPINLAMDQLRSDPGNTLMVGDSPHDILDGKNAGVQTAGVAWTIKGESSLASLEPDFMLRTMPDLLYYLGVKMA